MSFMRRKDRKMDENFALEVIDNSEYGVLGISGKKPYTIPLSIVRKEKTLYFHSALEGKKTEMINDGDVVSVSFVSRVNVPEFFSKEEVMEFIEDKRYGEIGSKVFTTEFSSAHVMGEIYKVNDEEEITSALLLVANKYTPKFSDISLGFIKNSLHRTSVYKIEIKEIKGKRKKFNRQGEELKFMAEDL